MQIVPPAPELLPQRARRYWHHFHSSGSRHGVDPLLLAAICDIESECGDSRQLDKSGPSGRGDGGHGHGLMQIDDRYHRAFLKRRLPTGVLLWTIPEENIEYATGEILSKTMGAFSNDWPAAVGAYNAGVFAVHRALGELTEPIGAAQRLSAINAVTARHNYVTRVLVRFQSFGGVLPWLMDALGAKPR